MVSRKRGCSRACIFCARASVVQRQKNNHLYNNLAKCLRNYDHRHMTARVRGVPGWARRNCPVFLCVFGFSLMMFTIQRRSGKWAGLRAERPALSLPSWGFRPSPGREEVDVFVYILVVYYIYRTLESVVARYLTCSLSKGGKPVMNVEVQCTNWQRNGSRFLCGVS